MPLQVGAFLFNHLVAVSVQFPRAGGRPQPRRVPSRQARGL